MISTNQLFQTAKAALLAGGDILRRGAREKKRITYKSALDPYTQVDLAIEKKVIGLIRTKFPTHQFLAEESSYQSRMRKPAGISGEYRWIIDPLDGTVNFIHRVPQSCVSIAVEKKGILLAGGVYDPYRDELFMAARGRGATMNGRAIRVSKETNLKRCLMVTGFPYLREKKIRTLMRGLQAVLSECADVRRFGSAALDLAWVACGRTDGYWESSLNAWDVAAGWLLVEEAGGKLSNFKGHQLNICSPQEILASNGRIHRKLVRLFLKEKIT